MENHDLNRVRNVQICEVSDSDEGIREENEHTTELADPRQSEQHLATSQPKSQTDQVNEVSSQSNKIVEDLCQSSDERILDGRPSNKILPSTLNKKRSPGPPQVVQIVPDEDSIEMTRPARRGWAPGARRLQRASPSPVKGLEIIQEESTVEITTEQSRGRPPLSSSSHTLGAKRFTEIEESLADEGLEELIPGRLRGWGRRETVVIDEKRKDQKPAPRSAEASASRPGAVEVEELPKPATEGVVMLSEESVPNHLFDQDRLGKLYNALFLFTYEPLKVVGAGDTSTGTGSRRRDHPQVKGEHELDAIETGDNLSENEVGLRQDGKDDSSLPCKIVEDPKEIAKLRYKGLDTKYIEDFQTEWAKLKNLELNINELLKELDNIENPQPEVEQEPQPTPPQIREHVLENAKIEAHSGSVKAKSLRDDSSFDQDALERLDQIYAPPMRDRRRDRPINRRPSRDMDFYQSPNRAELELAHKLIQEQLGVRNLKVLTKEDYVKLLKGSSRKKRSSRSGSRKRRRSEYLEGYGRSSKSRSKSKSRSRSRSRRELRDLYRRASRNSSAGRSRSRGSITKQRQLMGMLPHDSIQKYLYPRHFQDFRYHQPEMIRTADGRILIPKRLGDRNGKFMYPGFVGPSQMAANPYMWMKESEKKRSRSRSVSKHELIPPGYMIPRRRPDRSGQKRPNYMDYDHQEYFYPPYPYEILGEVPSLGKRWTRGNPEGFPRDLTEAQPGADSKTKKPSSSKRSKSKSARKSPHRSPIKESPVHSQSQAKDEEAENGGKRIGACKSKVSLDSEKKAWIDKKGYSEYTKNMGSYFDKDSSTGDEPEFNESTHKMIISPTTQRKLRQLSSEWSSSSMGPVRATKRASVVEGELAMEGEGPQTVEERRIESEQSYQQQLEEDMEELEGNLASTSRLRAERRARLGQLGSQQQAGGQKDGERGRFNTSSAQEYSEVRGRGSRQSETGGPNLWHAGQSNPKHSEHSQDMAEISKFFKTMSKPETLKAAQ